MFSVLQRVGVAHSPPILVRKTWTRWKILLNSQSSSYKRNWWAIASKMRLLRFRDHSYSYISNALFSILQVWSKTEKEENVERINETNEINPLKTIEYLWDKSKSFSITVLGFVLSLTTVAGWKPNQTKIKLNTSKIKLATIYVMESSCQNNKYKHRTDRKFDKSNSKIV